MKARKFKAENFARFHPGGTLGKRLSLKLSDLLHENNKPQVKSNTLIKNVILEISNKRLGATAVIEKNSLIGIITDGDLRRMLEKGDVINNLTAIDIMSKNPKTMDSDLLAYDGLKLMEKHNISQLIVLEKGQYAGIVHIHEIIKEGVV